VSFKIDAGEIVGLIGPNGAGKTTCLRSVAGLIGASGEITLDGRARSAFAPREWARQVAYLPQTRSVAWPLSVHNLVALGRYPHGEPESAGRGVVEGALKAVGMSDFAARNVLTLSGGELSLVLLARALAVGAPVLLADEPVASLDLAHQVHVMERLRAFARSGGSVLVVLHDLSLAARFCDRVLLLDRGHLAATGLPGEVLGSPAVERAYGVKLVRGFVDGLPVALAAEAAEHPTRG
jgi:iron complex transport system ATP-binding protein